MPNTPDLTELLDKINNVVAELEEALEPSENHQYVDMVINHRVDKYCYERYIDFITKSPEFKDLGYIEFLEKSLRILKGDLDDIREQLADIIDPLNPDE